MRGDRNPVLVGCRVRHSANLHDDNSGTFANLAAFLAAITPSSTTPPGTLVKVKGTVSGGAFATPPDEAEIEVED
ncbi:MAG: hypothetical protein OHK0028_24070 [Deltaproteobacteria bacterium]